MFTVINGNMLDELDKLKENSVGSIVTDPPYEINFMGNDWDNRGIAFSVETWKKCLRVLKPGGYLLSFSASRTQHRIACAIEDAGFEIRDTVMWIFGSGFPKSMDISKKIDDRGAVDTSYICSIIHNRRIELGLTLKDIDNYMNTNGMACHWEHGRCGITVDNFNKLIKLLKLDADTVFKAERDIIGTRKKLESFEYVGNNTYVTNGNKKEVTLDITEPSTDLAKKYSGFGTSLKPAYEPIIVARKPICGTVADNVITYGVGGLNIDECRIPYEETANAATNPLYRKEHGYKIEHGSDTNPSSYVLKKDKGKMNINVKGRFPANVILTYDDTDFDEVCGGFIYREDKKKHQTANLEYNDEVSPARYFYCAKASKRDRNDGIEGILNNHPTVKPTSLMQYLVRLVTPKGETVLDPFMGSGSTGKAVAYENNDRGSNYSFIGIEMNKEYCDIAERRIEFAKNDNSSMCEDRKNDSKPNIKSATKKLF